jgi:hypothetical protein
VLRRNMLSASAKGRKVSRWVKEDTFKSAKKRNRKEQKQ